MEGLVVRKKLTYQEVKEFIEGKEGNGCKLLSTEYVNNRTILQIRCACGEVFEKNFNNFKDGNQRQCNKCSTELFKAKQRKDYQEVKEFIEGEEGNGCKLLSTEYKSCKDKLQIRCACGEVFERCFDKFKNANQRVCFKCSAKLQHDKQKLTYQEIKEFVESCGCELLSTEYVNNRTKLQIRCACGEVFETSFSDFKGKNKQHCDKCGLLLRSGENHPNYNPNLTDEDRANRRLLTENKDWRNKVYTRDNYTCQCCGQKGGKLNAHHLNGHNWNEKYRTSKLNGITLCKKCHNEFHSIYGYGNNTIIQFRDFIYKKYLQTNDPKYLTILKDIDIRITLLVDNLTLSLVS